MVVEQGDHLDADGIAAHLTAFGAEPRAQLTWCGITPGTARSSSDPMACGVSIRGRRVGEWMAPRRFTLAVGPFDLWLPGHAVDRYAFRLAAHDPVVARVPCRLVGRPGGNPSPAPRSPIVKATVDMLSLADRLARPRLWRHCFAFAQRMHFGVGVDTGPGRDATAHSPAAERLDEVIRQLGDGTHRNGCSSRLAIALTLAGLATVSKDGARRRTSSVALGPHGSACDRR